MISEFSLNRIRKRWAGIVKTWSPSREGFCDVPRLIVALDEAQTEIARLQERLRDAETVITPEAMQSVRDIGKPIQQSFQDAERTVAEMPKNIHDQLQAQMQRGRKCSKCGHSPDTHYTTGEPKV